jgi:hypothetical protein
MPRLLVLLLICFATPIKAAADQPITEKQEFLNILAGRALTLGLFDLSLRVMPDGAIRGRAVGWDVTGTWDWKDGLFCREMDWSGMPIDYDCQLVEKSGDKLRFTSDAGKGRSASFALR